MSDLTLVQWSDLHFAPDGSQTLPPSRAVALASEAVRRDYGGVAVQLALSGDITTKGRQLGYAEAATAVQSAIALMNVSAVVVCPGNHDIGAVDPTGFVDFNRFAFRVTNDPNQQWDSRNPVRVVTMGAYSMVLVNSAYRGDHTVGAAPLAALETALGRTRSTHQVVILHHSPISSAYAGGGMADAYDLLALVSKFEVSAVLHGHVHSDQGLYFGGYPTLLYGAGSLGYEPDPNMNNQFVVHEFSEGRASRPRLYRYYRNLDRFGSDSA
ncbi:metallophosphoesterase family protein [Diaminobutyricibacter sp. McL0608]|uniref:metallophosphoesterase family protein n=1 Tax=Leifsonia sp. McL0608 TaxID=3143537 RepID=UPI0031F2E2C4